MGEASARRVTLHVFLVEDGMVTDVQVLRLREKRMAGKTLAVGAAAAGMSERTARKWQSGALPSTAKAPRAWRTREDPFSDVWQSEVVPQLVADTGRTAAGADAVHGAVPAASGSLSAGTATDVAAAGPGVAGAVQSRSRGVLRAGGGPGSGSGVRLHRRERPGRDAAGRGVPAPSVRVGAELQPVDVCGAGADRDVRGAGGRPAGRAVDAGGGVGGASSRQPVGGDARAEAKRRASVDGAVPAGVGPLRAALVADPAGEAARERCGRAVALPDEDSHRAGVAVAGRPELRRRGCVSGLRACGRRRGAECEGGGSTGRGAGVSATVAVGSAPGVHDVPVRGAEVEHDPGRRPDLLGAVAVDWSHRRGSSASVDGRGSLRRPGAVHDAASAGRGGAPDRLPPHHRELGPEARRLCAVSLPGGAVSVADVPGGV